MKCDILHHLYRWGEDVTFTAGQPGSFNLYGGQPGDPEVSGCYLMEQGIVDANGKYYELWNAQAQYYTE